MRRGSLWLTGLTALGMAVLFAANQGCNGKLPPLSAMRTVPTATITPNCAPLVLNDFENLAENGTWSGANATRSLSTLYVTHGTHSMDVNITTAAGYNQDFMILSGFSPTDWAGYVRLQVDVTVDASVVAGAGYSQFLLVADSSSKYFQSISGDVPILVAGTQTLTWNLDFTKGTLLPTDAITKLTFIYNRGTPAAGQGVGHLYVDNIRLTAVGCLPTPTATCVPTILNGCESLTENGNWTGANATRTLSALNVTQGSSSLDVNITTPSAYNQAFLILDTFVPTNWSGVGQFQMDVTADSSVVAGNTYSQMLLMLDAGGVGKNFQPISSDIPNLAVGSQTLTWNINFGAGTILPADAITKITFVYNRSAPGSGQGVGNLYVDNLRLLPKSCP